MFTTRYSFSFTLYSASTSFKKRFIQLLSTCCTLNNKLSVFWQREWNLTPRATFTKEHITEKNSFNKISFQFPISFSYMFFKKHFSVAFSYCAVCLSFRQYNLCILTTMTHFDAYFKNLFIQLSSTCCPLNNTLSVFWQQEWNLTPIYA